MGNGKNSHILYIIDFGLAKRFVDPKTGEHIPYRDGKSLTGTARYASLNTHIGQEQARRDDIESIAFVMIYFLKGCLPWQGVSGDTKEEKYRKIKEKKIDTPITDLSKNLPSQFLKFFELVRNIGFEDAPDYIALRTLLAEMFTNKNFQNDFQYDWVIKANKMSKGRYHSLTNDNRKTKEFYQGKHHYKGRNESSGKHKSGKFKNQNYKKEFNQKAWNGKGGREHKTQENFNPQT